MNRPHTTTRTLVAPYMVNSGHGIRDAMLPMLMTQPRFRSAMPGMTIRHMFTMDVMLHRTMSSNSCGPHPCPSLSSPCSTAFRKYSGYGYDSPTLLTNTPTSRPWSSRPRWPYTVAVSGSVKSARTHLTLRSGCSARISSAVASSFDWVRLTRTTSNPRPASCRAYALPSPSVAPVTTLYQHNTHLKIRPSVFLRLNYYYVCAQFVRTTTLSTNVNYRQLTL